jgi:hypothetical protein
MGFSMNDKGNGHPGTERERRIAIFQIVSVKIVAGSIVASLTIYQ